MLRPETSYVASPRGHIAYQVFGRGEGLLLVIPSWASSVEAMWGIDAYADLLMQMSRYTRVAVFDSAGTGLSDRGAVAGDIWDVVTECLAVTDALGEQCVSVLAQEITAAVAIAFAAAHPDRCGRVVLFSPTARLFATDDYPIGTPRDAAATVVARLTDGWGRPGSKYNQQSLPGAEFAPVREQLARGQRQAVSLGDIPAIAERLLAADVRELLPRVKAPVLVLHRTDDRQIPIAHGRWIAEHVPDGRLVELAGSAHLIYAGDTRPVVHAVEAFLGHGGSSRESSLSVLVFTDIAGSTERAVELGDDRWRALLMRHHVRWRELLPRYGGAEHSNAGDGFVSTFSSAAQAVRFCLRIHQEMAELDLRMRAGVHIGEVTVLDNRVHGLPLHVAARVQALADAGETLVTSGVREALSGVDDVVFLPRGTHPLRGLPDEWQIWRAVEPS